MNAPLKGLYLAALCDGMDKALEPFREDIVDIERIVLNDGHTPVSMILCRVQKYLSLFSVLNAIIGEVTFFHFFFLFFFWVEYINIERQFYQLYYDCK